MAGKVQSSNYIVIQGWMVTELGLKGGELLTYAIIYGFSQAEDQGYTGTIQYLAEWTGSVRQSVMNWLKSLCDKNLIERREYTVNNVKFVDYRSKNLTRGVKNFDGGSQKFLHEDVKNFDTDNTMDNTIDNSIDRESAQARAHARTRESDQPEQKSEEDTVDDSEPSLEDVKAYIKKHKLKVDAVTFVKYYESLGVRLGGMKLKSWKARLELWDRRERLGEEKNDKKKGPKNWDISNWNSEVDEEFEALADRSLREGGKKTTPREPSKEDKEIDELMNQLHDTVQGFSPERINA